MTTLSVYIRALVIVLLVLTSMAGCRDSFPPAEEGVGPAEPRTYTLAGPRWYLVDPGDGLGPATEALTNDIDHFYGAYIEFNPGARLIGFSGCNFLEGTFSTTPVGGMAVAGMALTTTGPCNTLRQPLETALLLRLRGVQSYRITGDTLELTSTTAMNGVTAITVVMKFVARERSLPLLRYIDIELGKQFFLPYGARGVVADEPVSIGIDSVIESRCPKNVQCISEGDGEVRLRVRVNGLEQVITLHTNVTTGADAADLPPYRIQLLALAPYPDINVNNGQIELGEYVATMVITR